MMNEVLAPFRELASVAVPPSVERWREEGRPVVGYFCHYVPQEILLAAGAAPLRLRGVGAEDSSAGDAYLSGRLCTYVRQVVTKALEGEYGPLAGVVCSNTCDHVRRAADVFRKKIDVPFQGFLSVPRSPREDLFPYYLRELERLYEGLCRALGTEPTGGALWEAIARYNAVRERLSRLNALRLGPRPKLSGADALSVHIASQTLLPEDFIALADPLLEALAQSPGLDPGRARVVLVGAELDEPAYVSVIESQGALVVADRLCFGARSVLPPVGVSASEGSEPGAGARASQGADPMDVLGRAYFFRPSCARMIGDFDARHAAILSLSREARADGVIFERLMFCDPWGADQHNLGHRAKEEGALPVLFLTREYGIVPSGQLRTRVQAFVERLEIRRAQGRSGGPGGQG